MRVTINVPFEFTATHALEVRPEQHGHRFRLTVGVTGPIDHRTGFIADMGRIRAIVDPLVAQLHGSCLNAHPLLADAPDDAAQAAANPTCETLARFFTQTLRAQLNALGPGTRLARVEVRLLEDGDAASAVEWGWAEVTL